MFYIIVAWIKELFLKKSPFVSHTIIGDSKTNKWNGYSPSQTLRVSASSLYLSFFSIFLFLLSLSLFSYFIPFSFSLIQYPPPPFSLPPPLCLYLLFPSLLDRNPEFSTSFYSFSLAPGLLRSSEASSSFVKSCCPFPSPSYQITFFPIKPADTCHGAH